jgi:FkbH-like protein
LLFLDGTELSSEKSVDEAANEVKSLYEKALEPRDHIFVTSNIHIKGQLDQCKNYNAKGDAKSYQSEFNRLLRGLAIEYPYFFVFDLLSIIERYGYQNLYDDALWHLGQVRLNGKANKLVCESFLSLLTGIVNQSKKCLVLDLDNTIWGGVVGEDGLDGIKLGKCNDGQVFKKLQKSIRSLQKKGVILALASKNNLEDVEEVFKCHDEMVLRWDDFSATKINWASKDKNIKEIAIDLNIGEDSLVFLDDNEFERELVRRNTDAVVPEFPNGIEKILDFFYDVDFSYFSKMQIIDDDRDKIRQYQENALRATKKNEYSSIDGFIRSLEIVLEIEEFKETNLNRIVQLTQKTNQFNLTTCRYTHGQIHDLVATGNKVFTGKVKDRFGDSGIVCLLILQPQDCDIYVDTFLMSCRVIGRKIEREFFFACLEKVRQGEQYDVVRAKYSPTRKNKLVEKVYEEFGFKRLNLGAVDDREYTYKLSSTFSSEGLLKEVRFVSQGNTSKS